MAASVWSGYLTFGLISFPYGFFLVRAVRASHSTCCRREDIQRVKQQLVCSADGQVIDRSDTVKGYEFRKGEYVVIEQKRSRRVEPRTAKTMEILEFVKTNDVDPVFFESSYT